ncbi:MAG: DUF971 domain-containing protein [Fibrobacteres bacterium]|nr:DUF971 domain-containing protein [Fibrobacterota bacterium]MBK9579822.1 DUF971 domain-containing protein [Fibrobacterota bacterium]QQS03902.1 MAG: DUF971 domain-containing protein [Fibrobacterota bacterium]
MSHAPVKIHRYKEGLFGVDWEDGNRTALPYRWLRGHCPCAHCVDEWTGVRRVGEAEVPFNVEPVRVESVGRYALRIHWNDKHDAGLYTYDYLRDLTAKWAQGPHVEPGAAPACGSKGGCV